MTEDETTDEKPEAIQDLETLDAALGDLEENGADADSDELADTVRIIGDLIDTAEETGDDSEEMSETVEALHDGRDAVVAVLDGEADEDDVTVAGETISTVGQQLQVALLQTVAGQE